ncbi:MAG: DEAD/DEAH box helicase family protein [Deltaproteobacteria bacterium]|nr:DEAD/DEAH box helicase family protein [Deltaproteobacteria bacterium]
MRDTALREAQALQGKGAFGARAEVLLKQVTQESVDAKVILPMMGASIVGQVGKVLTLGRLMRTPAGALTRGLGAKWAATASGFAAEGLAFAGLGRMAQGSASKRFGEDVARSYVGLGALKFSGWMGKGLASQGWQKYVVPQLTMFGGLLLAHRLEAKFGLRPEQDSDHLVADTLAAMVSLQLGTKLGHGLLGRRFQSFQHQMELAGQAEARERRPLLDFFKNSLALPITPEGFGFPAISLSEGAREAGPKKKVPSRPPRAPAPHPKVLLEEFAQHYDRIFRKLEQVFAKVSEPQASHYLSNLEQIEQRKGFWMEQTQRLAEMQGEERLRFEQDIGIGLGLLREKLLRVGAEIYQEPLEIERRPGWGLRFRPEKDPGEKLEKSPPKPAVDTVFALVNRDVGYGKDLSLREHQIAALHALRGRLRLLQSFVEDGATPPPEALAGTIVMPVGGGKTRTMVAGFAAAMELGWMNPINGDKLIILNHTDQIHGQNLKVAGTLSAYFKKKAGRPLKIGEYKADQKDVSGDVIVVSIPSIAEVGKGDAFQKSLKQALGDQGKVAMVAVDEVHHLGMGQGKSRETWAQAIQTIRDLSPQLFQIGFTATPTGKEAGRLFTVRERELMQAGVTPRTYLVKVDGIDLSQLKISASGEFEQRSLQSTLMGHPERNERVYTALNERGMRAQKLAPSGKVKLEPVLGFGQDLKHAESLAEDYVKYFARQSGDLGDRRLALLGKNRGKITAKELQETLSQYREGKIDGIVALVSGITQGQKDPVLQAVERGEIEAVFTVDALVEGADLFMFSHQIGARPTFSRFKKGQERGRINRRGPDEVSAEGQLLRDPPKILFDVADRYHGEAPLIRYGDILGIGGHTQLKNGEMLDAFSGEQAQEVDRSGEKISRRELGRPLPPKPLPKLRNLDSDWSPLIGQLEKVLSEYYHGDLGSLALDLGEAEGFVSELLEGRGWRNNRWFLQRLGTLLYQDRHEFTRAYREPTLAAFRQALAQIEAEGKRVRYQTVANLAWEFYVKDLSASQGPSQKVFQHLVSGPNADPLLLELLEASALVSKLKFVEVDRERVLSAFRRALAQIEAEGKVVSYSAVADLARTSYLKDFPEEDKPTQKPFRRLIVGSDLDPEVRVLVESSSLVRKQKQNGLDRERVLSVFRQALAQIELERKKVNYRAVTDLAWEQYVKDFSEGERPALQTFRSMPYEPIHYPELLGLLDGSPWVSKQRRAKLDREKMLSAFRKAIAEVEVEGRPASYLAVSDQAWEFYVKELPEGQRPSLNTFRGFAIGSRIDPEVWALLEASAMVSRKSQIDVDRERALSVFHRALAEIEDQKRKATYLDVVQLAWKLYCEGLPGHERPSQTPFRSLVYGSTADPEFLSLLETSAFVKKGRY